MLNCVLIADDLTGACDSAVHLKLRGARSVVHLDLGGYDSGAARVHAFDTETRDADAAEMQRRIHQIANLTRPTRPDVVFKKIDSLLRGQPGREIVAALEAFRCDLAIVTPAFPEMGRTVRDGHLEVHGDPAWQRLEVAALLRGQGLSGCTHIAPGMISAALEEGASYLSLDITTHDHLEDLAAEALATGRNILWAGSGGLASALAAALFPGGVQSQQHSPSPLPVVFCIGSNHPVTATQVSALQRERPTHELHAAETASAEISAALSEGRHVLLRIPRGQISGKHLRPLLQPMRSRAGAIVLSGGDTAAAVCRAADANEIDIADQVVPGLPWGTLCGGLLDGLPVATKSGAFGRENDLIQVADFFTCLKQ